MNIPWLLLRSTFFDNFMASLPYKHGTYWIMVRKYAQEMMRTSKA